MKITLIVLCIYIFTGCNNGHKDSKELYEDYSLADLKGINKLPNDKSENDFVEIKILKNNLQLVVHKSPDDNTIITIYNNSNFNVAKFHHNDQKYGPLPSYLVFNKNSRIFTDYSFVDNTITVDSLINCVKSDLYLTKSKFWSGSIHQRDTLDFIGKLLSGKDISMSEVHSVNESNKKFAGTVLEYLNYSQ